jgi:hypothetical protein
MLKLSSLRWVENSGMTAFNYLNLTVNSLCFNGFNYLALGTGNTGSGPFTMAFTSARGVDWKKINEINLTPGGYLDRLIFNGSYTCALYRGLSGSTYTTSDPNYLNWDVTASTAMINDMAWNGNFWLGMKGDNTGTIRQSFNGRDWADYAVGVLPITGTPYFKIYFLNNLWLIIPQNSNFVLTSVDGKAWIKHILPVTDNWYFGGWNGKYWVISSVTQLVRSTDLFTWQNYSFPPNPITGAALGISNLVVSNGVFVFSADAGNGTGFSLITLDGNYFEFGFMSRNVGGNSGSPLMIANGNLLIGVSQYSNIEISVFIPPAHEIHYVHNFVRPISILRNYIS